MKDGTQVTQMVMIKNDLKKWKVEKGEWKTENVMNAGEYDKNDFELNRRKVWSGLFELLSVRRKPNPKSK